jgi:hypothetical protein
VIDAVQDAARDGPPAAPPVIVIADSRSACETEIAQVVDVTVSREKFDRELAQFRGLEREYRRRGWWLLEATFPTVTLALVASQLSPPPVVCGVRLDFTNYDVEPPSVRLVNPFTGEPYRARDLPTALLRRRVVNVALGPNGPVVGQQVSAVPLMQAQHGDEVPFLCIPGVREYHAHAAHTGDAWLLHRGQGAGTLFHILQVIHQYGVQPIADYNVGLRVTGFQVGEPPA